MLLVVLKLSRHDKGVGASSFDSSSYNTVRPYRRLPVGLARKDKEGGFGDDTEYDFAPPPPPPCAMSPRSLKRSLWLVVFVIISAPHDRQQYYPSTYLQ